MHKSDVLQRIPHDQDFSYSETKDSYLEELADRLRETSVRGSVNWLMEDASDDMDRNGMEKFIIMISSMLFMIAQNDVNPDIAYGVRWDILDFETGNYDDLFTADDLEHIKADIKFINHYFDLHPELIAGVEEDRRMAQTK